MVIEERPNLCFTVDVHLKEVELGMMLDRDSARQLATFLLSRLDFQCEAL